MQIVAIHDSSILIDLIRIQLLDKCLLLPYSFGTTRFIFEEIDEDQQGILQLQISKQKFQLFPLSAEDLQKLSVEQLEDARLSQEDWSALYCARKHNGLLLTGDGRLRKKAEEKVVPVHGVLWILDELVRYDHLSFQKAIQTLKVLQEINSRLPANECEKKIKEWSALSDE